MRVTDKKCMKSPGRKKGVILVTILFIVAMALIFVTTALTITIAGRKRIYENAASDQARLTVTSLSQAIWQAIYSQQINDAMLYNLAKGVSGNGTVVSYEAADIPGMQGADNSNCTAYFYFPEAVTEDSMKIAVECKCEINGFAQYYTLTLQYRGESNPAPVGWKQVANFGDASLLNRVIIGVDARKIGFDNDGHDIGDIFSSPHKGHRYVADDNIIHFGGTTSSPITSNTASSGIYGKLIVDGGPAYLRDVTFADTVYFVGENAGFDWSTTSQLTKPEYEDPADLYFWGTRVPFYIDGAPRMSGDSASMDMRTVNDIYFDYRDIDSDGSALSLNTSTRGFDAAAYSNPRLNLGIAGNVYYEVDSESGNSALNYFSASQNTGSWVSFTNTDKVPVSFITSNLTPDDNSPDTVGEVYDWFDVGSAPDSANTLNLSDADAHDITLGGGDWVCDGGTLKHFIVCTGNTRIYVRGHITIEIADGGTGSGFKAAGDDDYQVSVILIGGAQILVKGGNPSGTYPCGFIDERCFRNTSHTRVGYPGSVTAAYRLLDQSSENYNPRFYIYTTSSRSSYGTAINGSSEANGCAIQMGTSDNRQNLVLTAYIGFYPTTEGGSDGCRVYFHSCVNSLYYGRMACAGLTTSTASGGCVIVPYCPSQQSYKDPAEHANRVATSFEPVITESGYFTAYTGAAAEGV